MTKILDFVSFKCKKEGRPEPLVVDHSTGKITTRAKHLGLEPPEEFGDRIDRVKASLDKINRLMADLKKLSEERDELLD